MDATQALDDFDEEEFNNSGSKKTVAFLKVKAVGEFPDTLFPVYEGENIVGRHDNCDITIPLQAVSKKHACIDVHGKNHLICDYNSRNKTRRNRMFLKPQAFYELVHEVELMFADVKCQYLLAQGNDVVEKDIVSDSGSETASESMMPQSAEDDEEPEEDPKEEKLTISTKSEKLHKESMEEYLLDQPTQDYTYKNPDENSPVFCAETDDDKTDDDKTDDDKTDDDKTDDDKTDDDKTDDDKTDDDKTDDESGGKDKTEVTETNSNIDTTLACNTLPNTLEPDTIPATPFTPANEFEPPFKLKRAVDVKIDTSRRISAGNTLAYGLSTLESPDSTWESVDVSVSERKESVSDESTSAMEVKNKLLFDATEQRSPDKKEKRLLDSIQDEILDDLVATQLYEPMEIPESPEILKHEDDFDKSVEESTKTESDAEGKICQGINPSDKNFVIQISPGKYSERKTSEDNTSDNISEDKNSERRISEDNVFECQTFNCPTPKDKSSASKIFGDKVVNDDTVETQAFGFDTLPQDEDMATQAYGLTLDPSDTGDELATQAYGIEDDIEVPKVSNVFKVPGAMNTQELNEDKLGNIDPNDDGTAKDEKVGNEEDDDEMDIQPTQNYIENQVMESGETSESSNSFPSFASFMGLKSDSDSDFVPSKKKVKPKIPLQSSTPAAANKTSSIIIEGENTLSTEKRCYIEYPGIENDISQDEEHEDKPNTRKKSVRGRKKATTTQNKVKDDTMMDTTELSTTQSKHDKPTRSTRNDTAIRKDTSEQQETIVVKRGKGSLSTRSKRSTAIAQNSEGKRNEGPVDETKSAVAVKAEVESLPKARKNTRKRKISEVNTKTESNEGEWRDVKVEVESMKTECKDENVNISDGEEEMLKLQISTVDSPERDHFIPKSRAILGKKRQRGKKGPKEELECSNEFKTTNIEVEKHLYPTAKEIVPMKSTRKGRSKKNQEEAVKQDIMVGENPDNHTQQSNTIDKSVEAIEQDAMTPVVNRSRTARKGRQSATRTVKSGADNSVEQNLDEKQNNNIDEQEGNATETKVNEVKTPVKGRSRKRKSSENSMENTQQKKGTAKKSRTNVTAEENVEMKKDETQEDTKFESEERKLTPRSLSRRSSSSSSINLSRSARKGKKQEKDDSKGSNGHSSDVKIIFTGLQDSAFIKAKKIVETLGGEVVERLEDCTHLVTDKVRRTVKLLCAVSRGIPVMDMGWLDASKKSKSFVDSASYILKDKEAQKKFDFSMEKSLKVAENAGLLDGYKIYITPHVRPPPNDMKEIIKSAKGQIISKMPASRDNNVIVLSCDEDRKMCQKANIENVYTAELLLTGILRQEIDLEQHKLISNATSVVNSSPMKSKGRRKR